MPTGGRKEKSKKPAVATAPSNDPWSIKDGVRGATELPALVSYVRQRRCILFVGAGLSRAAGFPDWNGLMQHVVSRTVGQTGQGDVATELEALLQRGKLTEVADQCRLLVGRAHFAQILREVLDRQADPPRTHAAIVRTPYAGIVTTNFDTLLETAYERWGTAGVPRAPTGAELAQHGTLLLDGSFFILKAHGTIDDETSMVFTSEDYRRITHANPAFQAMMSAMLLSHAILFVGYSLNDPNFRLLLDSQLSTFGVNMPPRYALMEDVGPTEQQILRRTAGIEVLPFAKGAFEQVGELLEHLADNAAADALGHGRVSDDGRRPALPTERTILRDRGVEEVFVVRLRARGPMIDCSWYRSQSTDLRGVKVPPSRQYAQVGSVPDWTALRRLMSDAAYDRGWSAEGGSALHEVGEHLARAIGGVTHVLPEVPPETTVVLDVAPELAALPWEWTLVEGFPLAFRLPVYRTVPELSEASRGRPMVGSPLRVLLIADTLSDLPNGSWSLPGALAEAKQLEEMVKAAGHEIRVLRGGAATYRTVRDEIARGVYDIVHVAGHGWFDDRGTILYLHDGRVNASELVTLLAGRPPALLIVSSHYSGLVPAFCDAFPVEFPVSGSYEDFYRKMRGSRPGLERAAARAGVGAYIGCMGSPTDDAAAAVEIAAYRSFLAGETLARALWVGRQEGARSGDATAMQFGLSGFGDLRMTERASASGAGVAPRTRTKTQEGRSRQ